MKRTIMIALLTAAISCPVWADVNSQKASVQQKYDNEKSSETQSYNNQVSNAKQKYQNDPTKLNNVLKELEIKHTKKMDDLNNNENMDLQKISEKGG